MTSPDNTPTNATETGTSTPTGPSLARMLETWQAWNGRETSIRAAARAHAAGDDETADRLDALLARDRDVAALDALRAQHEIASLLAGWEWLTMRAAREEGATWVDIARVTRTDPEQARAAYLDQVEQQEQAAARGWLPFDDAGDYRAAAGQWHEELYPDIPDHVVAQIEDAIGRDDVDELAALRGAWWNPGHIPPGTVPDAATDNVDPWASRSDTGQVPHTHSAAADRGVGDANQQDRGWWAQARSTDPDVAPLTFDPSGFYSDAQIAAVADALHAGDTDRARELQDRPWQLAQGVTDDRDAHGESAESGAWPVMPEWMREQARRTEAEMAAATYEPGPPDDPAVLTARLAELRQLADKQTEREPGRDADAEREAVREEDPRSYGEMMGDAATALYAARGSTEDVAARREQLTRWHTDDTAPVDADVVHGDYLRGEDVDVDDGGPSVRPTAIDDGPGLP